jgi:hypothetical protein
MSYFGPRTSEEGKIRQLNPDGSVKAEYTVPVHTACTAIIDGPNAGKYAVDDLSWIPKEDTPLILHALNYGIVFDAGMVEVDYQL